MSPYIISLLGPVIQMIENLVATEGPVVIAWIEGELEKLKAKYPAAK